jgi:hypothetical protein
LAFRVVSTGTWAASAKLRELGGGVGVEHALAHVEQRILGGEQCLHGGAHVVGIGTGPPTLHGGIGVLGLVVLAEVAGDDEEHRPGSAGPEMGEGAPRVVRHEIGAVHLAHPLGDGLESLRHVVMGVAAGADADALGDDEQRGGVLPRLGDGAIGHLDARRVEVGHHRADPDLLAVGHPRDAVGHRHREALLPHHEDGDALFAQRIVHVVGGIAAHPRNPLGLEDPREAIGRLDLHRTLLPWDTADTPKSPGRIIPHPPTPLCKLTRDVPPDGVEATPLGAVVEYVRHCGSVADLKAKCATLRTRS